ncbi:MAG: hypothetical protein KDF54_14040 [Hydrogenophaga sp.]|nr:hypothetical protein [Hydrogenophaga sp.]
MASDLDTVRVLRALFNDMPRAPQGLSHEATMEWIQRSMTDFPGGELAYTIEHITRNSMLDIVLRLREDGYLKDDKAFDETVKQLETPEGRKTFADWCIHAQKSVDATARLLNRAKRAWHEPEPLFVADPVAVRRFIDDQPTGPGAMFAEFAMRDDVREVGVFEGEPDAVHEFDWGFIAEEAGAWNVYVADIWRKGTVGHFERMLGAWRLETTHTLPEGESRAPHVPAGLTEDIGIARFCALTLNVETRPADPAIRQWVGEVFISHMLPIMAARALDENYDFPLRVMELN